MLGNRGFGIVGGGLIATGVLLSAAVVHADGYKAAPRAQAPFSWTGLYGGLNAGYGWNDNSVRWDGGNTAGDFVLNSAFVGGSSILALLEPNSHSQSIDASGGFVGGQLGYNLQFARHWVAGLEVDIQSGFNGERSNSASVIIAQEPNTFTAVSDWKLKYFGTVRGRLGFLISPHLLVFGTGGLAYGETRSKANIAFAAPTSTSITLTSPDSTITCVNNAICLAGSETETSVGWTVGGGVEWAVSKNTMLKFEYLHVDLGDESVRLVAQAPSTGTAFVTTRFDHTFDILRAGFNVKF